MGGPSVFPALPAGHARAARRLEDCRDADERNRRSVYIFVRRNTRYPMLEAFDMPDTHESCPRRDVTTTAPQALTHAERQAVAANGREAFAGRAICEPDRIPGGLRAFRLAYSRPPDACGERHRR